MSVIIYVNGELNTDEELTEKQKSQIEHLANGAFGAGMYSISFASDMIEGCDPYEDYVLTPLKELLQFAQEEGISIDGAIEVSSDWQDYDNITVNIENNELSFGNTEIINASTEELIKELQKRKVLPKNFLVLEVA